jgi:hypothetical protein
MAAVSVHARTSYDTVEDFGAPEMYPDTNAASAQVITLKRSGERPVRFKGFEICCASSHRVGPPFWYEINIFRTVDDRFFADVRLYQKSDAHKDRFTVFEAGSFDMALEALKSYDPLRDIAVEPFFDGDVAPVEIALEAARLRLRIEEARQQYDGLIGDVLNQIEVR